MIRKIITLFVSAAAALSLTANTVFAALPIENAAVYDGDETVTFIVEVEGDALLASDAAAELGTDYIGTEEAQEQETEILKTQAKVLSDIQSEAKVKESKGYTYTAVFNGFSIDAPKDKMDEIKAIDGVKNVYIMPEVELKLASAVEMTSSLPAQTADDVTETGYTGEGQVIAIIDSEFDVGHEFFSTAPKNPKLSKSDVAGILEKNTMNVEIAANQVYKSEKIPFVYDYANKTADTYISDDDLIHGTHVTGIAAGGYASFTALDENGDSKEYEMTGVAPDAQVVLMKVSTSEGYLSNSAMVAAMDDAVKIGVCAINFSIGAAYGSSAADSVYAEVVDNLNKAGVTLCSANGNEGISYASSSASADMPDYGTVNSPACFSSVTAVASANNVKRYYNKSVIKVSDEKEIYYTDILGDNSFYTAFAGAYTEYADCGSGTEEEIEAADVEGKIALIDCGEDGMSSESVYNAQNNGAVGAVIYNNGTTTDYDAVEIPVASVEYTDGEYLKNAETKTLTADRLNFYVPANTPGEISPFSSWGVDQTLELKPEITAPGGNIYSSYPGDKYEVFSGTSMATPHMTGVTALMNEYLDKNEIDISGTERVSLIENMLMSAADIIYQPENDDGDAIPYAARIQGAGLVNTAAAMKTSAIFIGNSGKSKLSLGDKLGDSFTLNFTVKNLTDTEVTYDSVALDVLTDGYETDEDGNNTVALNNTVRLTVVEDDAPESITISANGEEEVSINVTLASEELAENSEIFTNGFFIDGFITLASSEAVTISMPFTGFYGDWTSQAIFDKTMYDEGGSVMYDPDSSDFSGTYLYTYLEENGDVYYSHLGVDANGEYNKDMIAISPNGDGMGDELGVVMSTMRAVKNPTLKLTDGDIEVSEIFEGVTMKYWACRLEFDSFETLDEAELPDGEYTLTVSGVFDYEGAENESFELPVTVDRVAPKITGASIDGDTLYVSVSDNNYLYYTDIVYTDASGEEAYQISVPNAEKGGKYTAEFDISDLDANNITISVYDTALNSTEIELSSALGTVIANMAGYTAVENMTAATVELYNSGDSSVDGDAVIAFYDEDGALIAVSAQSVSIDALETAEYDFEMFADTQNAASAKLFIWDGVSGMRPLDIEKSFDLAQYN